MSFSYTIVADVCEGTGACISVCPVECIHWAKDRTNAKRTQYAFIDAQPCINCYACMSVCPIEGAILDYWRPELQGAPSVAQTYGRLRAEWRTEAVLAAAVSLRVDLSADALVAVGRALSDAGCSDEKLLEYCASSQTCSGGQWVADLILDGETSDTAASDSEAQHSQNVLATSVESLDISVRAANILGNQSIETIGQLCQLTAQELQSFRGYKEPVLESIREALAKLGLKLRED